MSIRFSRRAVILGGTAATLAGGRFPALAQQLDQGNQGQGTYWQPVLSELFVVRDQGMPTYPENDGPPVFPYPDLENAPEGSVTPDVAREKGLLHFSLLPRPLDGPPSIDSDWLQYEKLYKNGEHASAIVVARDFGKPRLFMHRTIDEDYLATYPSNVRLNPSVTADIGREKLPIPNGPSGAERTKLIRQEVRIKSGRLEVNILDKVKRNGSGGEIAEAQKVESYGQSSLSVLTQHRVEIIARAPTILDGDVLNGVYSVKIDLELEAGPSLGLAAPESRKISAEIRIAMGEQYLDIRILGKK